MKKIIIVFMCVALSAAAPLFPVKKETKLIMDELQKLTGKIEALGQVVAEMASGFSALKKKIDIIEEKIAAISRDQADMSQSKESLLLSMQFIKEEINELKNSVGRINDMLVSMPGGGVSPGGEGNNSSGQASSAQSPDTIYYTAYSDYIKKNYQYAIAGFRQFIKLYPNNTLADNCYYWIGECYYAQKMYQEAVGTFTDLIDSYSDGDKIPDAILKKGFALIEMGKQSEGIEVLKELTSKFPLSEEASLAQQKIREVME
ncbi:MAG: tol-pal system protein YbgF [Candidatus Aminicenantes bacterium]|nr:tol-pal system protein YbgF [Candidatus Aminicenantes bacterium]